MTRATGASLTIRVIDAGLREAASSTRRALNRLTVQSRQEISWISLRSDVPDLTSRAWPFMWPMICTARSAEFAGVVCTRRGGHTGRHAAGDRTKIIAVWGDRS